MTLRETLVKATVAAIEAELQKHAGPGRMQRAAKALGISRKNLWEKMRRYGIDKALHQPQAALPWMAANAETPPRTMTPDGAVTAALKGQPHGTVTVPVLPEKDAAA